MRFRTAWIAASLCLLCAVQALAFSNFNYECRNHFISKPAGQDHIFKTPLSAVPPGNDQVRVLFEQHLPITWSAQWCQSSSGICFPDSATITLTAGQPDTLKVYFFVNEDITPQHGWINVKIQSIADPLEVAYCTYTFFSGLPVPPEPQLVVDCTDNTRQLTAPLDVEFFSPMENESGSMDTLVCTMTTNLPGDWGAQFCQRSTGICYFEYGEMEMAPGVLDSLWVEVFPGSAGIGACDFVLQSKRNPSFAQYCYYRVYVGQGTTAAPELAPAATAQVRVVPNPSSTGTLLLVRNAAGGTGSLAIFAADGRRVREFPALELRDGALQLRWDGRDERSRAVPGGAYFYSFRSGGQEVRGLLVRSR